MKITDARVWNYKCFEDSGRIQIGETSTVLVGQNSAGKTAFLEALSVGTLQEKPHRKPGTGEFPYIPAPGSKVAFTTTLSGAELQHRILAKGGNFTIPAASTDPPGYTRFIDNLFRAPSLEFRLTFTAGGSWGSDVKPSHQLCPSGANVVGARISVDNSRRSWKFEGTQKGDDFPNFVGDALRRSIYVFRAERMNIGESAISDNPELLPDASNLPSVLLHLPGNMAAHQQYLKYLREVFPIIYGVAASPVSTNRARIAVTMNDPAAGTARPGIDVPLQDSGTGIGQVLAMLYVAVTAPAPRIIVIDEPNSFIHPGAVKKLLAILRTLPHQYIVSTHSPDIIRTLDPAYIHLTKWEGTAAVFQTLDRAKVADQRQLLTELGVRLSDVFGADNVLWVEGPTEEHCFPLLRDHLRISAPTTSIVPMIAIGDLEGRRRPRAALAWELYERLSAGTALVPPAMAFSFDREGRTPAEMEDMTRRSKGVVHFLPTRTYENFLIDADAIYFVLREVMEGENKPSLETIADWLRARARRERIKIADYSFFSVDGARVLHDAFSTLSGATVEYRKTIHSVALTKWLLANKPEHMTELLEYVRGLFAVSSNG